MYNFSEKVLGKAQPRGRGRKRNAWAWQVLVEIKGTNNGTFGTRQVLLFHQVLESRKHKGTRRARIESRITRRNEEDTDKKVVTHEIRA